jgi:hypothetical protein
MILVLSRPFLALVSRLILFLALSFCSNPPSITPEDSNITSIFETQKNIGAFISLDSSKFYFIEGSIKLQPNIMFNLSSSFTKSLTVIIKAGTSFELGQGSKLYFINLNFYKEKSFDTSLTTSPFFGLTEKASLWIEVKKKNKFILKPT